MNGHDAVAKLKSALGEQLQSSQQPSAARVYVEVAPQAVPAATQVLIDELAARFQTASGVDTPANMEILYHWAIDSLWFGRHGTNTYRS